MRAARSTATLDAPLLMPRRGRHGRQRPDLLLSTGATVICPNKDPTPRVVVAVVVVPRTYPLVHKDERTLTVRTLEVENLDQCPQPATVGVPNGEASHVGPLVGEPPSVWCTRARNGLSNAAPVG